MKFKAAPVVKTPKKDAAADLLNKAAAAPGKLIDSGQKAIAAHKEGEQAKVDAAAGLQDAPTPTPATEAVMAQTTLTNDCQMVNSTRIDAAPAASAAFRTF